MTNDSRTARLLDQPARFTDKTKENRPAFLRWRIGNYHAGQADICLSQGDRAGYDRHMAISQAASAGTLSLSFGPPVAIAGTPTSPPTLPAPPTAAPRRPPAGDE